MKSIKSQKSTRIIFALLAAVALMASVFMYGCSTKTDENLIDKENPIVKIDNKENVTIDNNKEKYLDDSGSTQAGVDSIVDANNKFAFDLYSRYSDADDKKGKNMFFSPYSISTALGMTYEGARGDTAEEMKKVFYFPDDISVMRSSMAKVYNDINAEDNNYQLSTANALWAEKEYVFLDDYFRTIDSYYGGKVTNMDFKGNPEGSRKIINTWIEDRTNDRIKDMLEKGSLKSDTKLVLTNAIYFKANWSKKFDAGDTTDGKFMLSSGENLSKQMMHIRSTYNYSETQDLQILEMDYLGNDLSMLVILPKENDMNNIENIFIIEKLDELKKGMNVEDVSVTLPKFKFETKEDMKEDLEAMGMPSAFDNNADFSGITGRKDLVISEVIHQTFIEVAENGTEAAAATVVKMKLKSIDPRDNKEPKFFTADHPFIFIIQQKETGNILFMGKVENPTA